MEIRSAEEFDRKEIAYVFADSFSDDWKILSSDTKKVAKAIESGLILNDYIVAVIDGKVVGFLALVTGKTRAVQIPIRRFQKDFGFFKGFMIGMALKSELEKVIPLEENGAYIDILGVLRAYQRIGVASALIDYLLMRRDHSSYLLSVTDINLKAIDCYTKKGFKEVKREKVKFAKQRGYSECIYLQYSGKASDQHSENRNSNESEQ